MGKRIVRALACVLVVFTLAALPAQAAVTWLVGPGGILTGADGVQVDSATAASQALLDQVFLDMPEGAFDTDMQLTSGCPTAIVACDVLTPYSAAVDAVGADHMPVGVDSLRFLNGLSPLVNTIGFGGSVYAVWSPQRATVPEPAGLACVLLALALATAAALRPLRRSATAPPRLQHPHPARTRGRARLTAQRSRASPCAA